MANKLLVLGGLAVLILAVLLGSRLFGMLASSYFPPIVLMPLLSAVSLASAQ
jgi:hypothetical protein